LQLPPLALTADANPHRTPACTCQKVVNRTHGAERVTMRHAPEFITLQRSVTLSAAVSCVQFYLRCGRQARLWKESRYASHVWWKCIPCCVTEDGSGLPCLGVATALKMSCCSRSSESDVSSVILWLHDILLTYSLAVQFIVRVRDPRSLALLSGSLPTTNSSTVLRPEEIAFKSCFLPSRITN